MATLADENALIGNAEFRGRVKAGLIGETNTAYSEDPGAQDHAGKVQYANLVLSAPDSCVDRSMPILLTNGDVSGSAPDGVSIDDGTLRAVIWALWPTFAKQQGFIPVP